MPQLFLYIQGKRLIHFLLPHHRHCPSVTFNDGQHHAKACNTT
nr:MAG TPA: hypothetical protein [Caudoviricetes sp.]